MFTGRLAGHLIGRYRCLKPLFLLFLAGRLTGHLVGRLMPSTRLMILLSFRCVPQCVAVIGVASILLTILAVRFTV